MEEESIVANVPGQSATLHSTRLAAVWLIWIGLLLVSACAKEKTPPVRSTPAAPVQLLVDFNGRGENKQFQVDWNSELTAFDCLRQLAAADKLTLASRGDGAQTLVTAIDGLENQWSAGDNWIYTVNDRLGDRSSAVFPLSPGDRLVWRFGKYKPE